MRAIAWSTLAVLAICTATRGEGFWPKSFGSERGLAQVCIEHPGANGRVNIVPITILIHEEAELTIHGESAVCYFTGASTVKISLRFPYPYSGPSERPKYWTAGPFLFDLRPGKITDLAVCGDERTNRSGPDWAKTGWHRMWSLKRVGRQKADPCGFLKR